MSLIVSNRVDLSVGNFKLCSLVFFCSFAFVLALAHALVKIANKKSIDFLHPISQSFVWISALVVSSLSIFVLNRYHAIGFEQENKKAFVAVQTYLSCEMLSVNRIQDSSGASCLARRNKKPSIFVFGNSHASNFIDSLEAVKEKLGYDSVYYLTNIGALEFVRKVDVKDQFWSGNPTFLNFRDNLQKNDLVIFSPYPSLGQQKKLAAAVQTSGARLVFIDNMPKLCDDKSYLSSFTLGREGCVVSKSEATLHRQTSYLKEVSKSLGAKYIDPVEVLCSRGFCRSTFNGNPLYADGSPHMTIANKLFFKSFFEENLPQMGSK